MENAEELEKLLQYKDDEKVLEKLREIKGNAKKELEKLSEDDAECGY